MLLFINRLTEPSATSSADVRFFSCVKSSVNYHLVSACENITTILAFIGSKVNVNTFVIPHQFSFLEVFREKGTSESWLMCTSDMENQFKFSYVTRVTNVTIVELLTSLCSSMFIQSTGARSTGETIFNTPLHMLLFGTY